MTLLSRYIARRIFVPFAAGTSILLLALSLERLLRLIEDVSSYDVPLWNVLKLLLYLMPHYLGLAIPAALFFAVFLALRALHDESAIAVIRGAGITQEALLKPVLTFAGIMSVILLILVWWAQPLSRYDYRLNLHELKIQTRLETIAPGTFMRLGDDIVMRVDSYDAATGEMSGFFAAYTPGSNKNTYISAQTARLLDHSPNASLSEMKIALTNGRMVKTGSQGFGRGKDVLPVSFTTYIWTPDFILPEAYGPRGNDERELTFGELASGGIPGVAIESPLAEIRTELHARLVKVFSLPFLALLAVPLAFIGTGRTGKASGLITGVFMLIGYEKVLGLAENLAEKALPSHSPYYLWGVLVLLVLFSCSLYARSSDSVRYSFRQQSGKGAR